MEKNEILEGNKLIAEFLGYKSGPNRTGRGFGYYDLGGLIYHSNELRYHSSWNWLMPVVKKISTIHQYPNMLKCDYGDFMDADIDTIWQAVVEFIKQHTLTNVHP